MWLLVATAVLLGIAGWSRVLQGTWAAPGAFFSLVWIVAAAPAALILPNYVTSSAMLLVASFALAVLLGSQLMLVDLTSDSDAAFSSVDSFSRSHGGSKLRILPAAVSFLGVCGFAACVGYVWDAGYELPQLVNGGVWLEMALHYSVARYQQDYVEPASIRLLVAANYAGAICGGVLLATEHRFGRRLLGALSTAAGTVITVITTAKSAMLLTALFTLAGWLSFKSLMISRPVRGRSLKRMFVLAAIFVAIAVVGTASLVLRYGEGTDADLITERVGGYLFGHMAALSAWLAVEDWRDVPHTWGALSFAGPAEVLNLTARTVQGFYNQIGLNDWAAESNVFTALRGAITDFGLFGAWIAAMLMGAFGGLCYRRLRSRAKATSLSMTGLAVFYGFAGWSPFVSILAYNVTMLAIVITAVVLEIAWSEIRAASNAHLGEPGTLPLPMPRKEVER
jgi:oligosaccharide repeat unit polymerase